MTGCKWDSEAKDYLLDGQPCHHDSYGDPTRHCTARRTCSQHVGPRELTCARCIGRVRQDIRAIVDLAVLMPYEALADGVASEAANLAGPAADFRVFEARRSIDRSWIYANIQSPARDWCDDPYCQRRHFKTTKDKDRWHKRGIENALQDLLEDDDEWHPYSVLTRWEAMIREDYGHPVPTIERCRMRTPERAEWETHVSPERARQSCRVSHGVGCWKRIAAPTNVTMAAGYLDRNLVRLAQDDEQDFPLFRREVRRCRQHMEAVLRNSTNPDRGAPCPTCIEHGKVDPANVRLQRQFGHFCLDEDCEQINYGDDSGDIWVCPANRKHWWTAGGYANLIEERTGGRTA